ncbi:MAG: response regulator [Synechococcaceae cyanobacterium RL_1_2]|nr:response regulator [Synechococcaceae cyanobacterium RL_1_2]
MTKSNFSETPRILVADDERVTRMMLSHLLSQLGYEVVQANNGQECLDIYKQGQKPDMVLLDAMMPVMDGFRCCEELEKLYQEEIAQKGSEAIRTPILMITALGDDANAVDRAFSVGAIDYIAKPIEKAILKQRLKRILEATAAERALRENESKYRSLVDNLNEVIFQTDLEGNITFLNPAWSNISQYSLPQSLNKSFVDFIYPPDREIHQRNFDKIKHGVKGDCRYAVRYIRKDNSIGWIEIYMNLMYRYNNSILGVSGSLNDISDRKAREKYLEVETITNQIFAEGLSLRKTIHKILKSICSNLDWDIGQLWMIDRQNQELTCWQSWVNPEKRHFYKFTEESMTRSLQMGEGLSGMVGEVMDYAWIPHIQDNQYFKQRETANKLGICSAFIIPVMDIDDRLGALNFIAIAYT